MNSAQLNAAQGSKRAGSPCAAPRCEPPSMRSAHLRASTPLRGVELRAFADRITDGLAFRHNRRANGVACRLCGHRNHEHELQSFEPRCTRCGAAFFLEG